jgi:hypothetical protein
MNQTFISTCAFLIAALPAPTVANSEQLQPNSEGHTELRYRAEQSSPDGDSNRQHIEPFECFYCNAVKSK